VLAASTRSMSRVLFYKTPRALCLLIEACT
jgi:hypothetical protein